jgi:GNAT superfamily N-acetyltransferase
VDNVRFRPARPADADALTELAVVSKRHWGYPESLIELWRDDLRFTADSIRRHIVLVAEFSGDPIGVVAISVSEENAEVEHLWVHPRQMGNGVGRELLLRGARTARDAGAGSLVIESDPHAEGFYRRIGAALVGSVASKPPGRRLPKLVLPLACGDLAS